MYAFLKMSKLCKEVAIVAIKMLLYIYSTYCRPISRRGVWSSDGRPYIGTSFNKDTVIFSCIYGEQNSKYRWKNVV